MKQANDTQTRDLVDELSPAVKIEKRMETLEIIRHNNEAEMQRLKEDGLCNASEHWRQGKYLYLIYPSQDGERKREYVGADPARIAEAKRHRENEVKYQRLKQENREIETKLYVAKQRIKELANYLGVSPHW